MEKFIVFFVVDVLLILRTQLSSTPQTALPQTAVPTKDVFFDTSVAIHFNVSFYVGRFEVQEKFIVVQTMRGKHASFAEDMLGFPLFPDTSWILSTLTPEVRLRDTSTTTASLLGSIERFGWRQRSEQSGKRRGLLCEGVPLVVLLCLLCLTICVRLLLKQTSHVSEEKNTAPLLASVKDFVLCALVVLSFQSDLLKKTCRHRGKERGVLLSVCGHAGVETTGNNISGVTPLKCDPEMNMSSEDLDFTKKQTTSLLTRLQECFLPHLLNFRRDQSFTQKCTVCPASVSLASHFASGTYGQPGSSQQLQKEGVRLASFKDFPTSVHVSAIRLAQAGFFYTGERDMVRCFSCGVTHDGWQMGDRPTLVHARISPNCPLVRGSDTANLSLPLPVTNRPNFPEPGSSSGVPSASVSSGSASYSVTQSNAASSMVSSAAANGPIASSLATPENSMFSGAPLFGTATPTDGGAPRNLPMPTKRLDLGGAVYPLYSQMDARKRSFSNWAEDQGLPSVDELVRLGFFYAGYADCVRCFFCGIGLKSWEPGDIPAEVHARWRPTCEYLRLVKGDEFVDQVANGGRVESNTRTSHLTAQQVRSESHIVRPEGALCDESSHDFSTVDLAAGTTHCGDCTDLPPAPGDNDAGRRITTVRWVNLRSTDGRQDRSGERGNHREGDRGQPVLNQSTTMEQLIHRYGWLHAGRSDARRLSNDFGRNCFRCQSRPVNVLLFNCHDCVLCHVCVSEVDVCPRCNQQFCGYWVQPF